METTTPDGLPDQHGRVATDLRVSLTDKCNLRCTYCLPEEGVEWLRPTKLLNDDEVSRLVRIAVEDLGVRDVRFTGGEPLLRPGIANIVAKTAALDPRPGISLTSNGIGLDKITDVLADAGLDRINVSLDTLQRDRFRELSKRDKLDDVLRGLDAAANSRLAPIKVNAVLLRGVNDDEAPALLAYCLDRGYELRFIEQMPLDPMHGWSRDQMVTADEIRKLLRQRWDLTPSDEDRGSAPAEKWLINGGPATVGIIASITEPFCGDCNRTRLTADGQIRNCLFSRTESDLRTPLRAGASDQELADLWRAAMWTKAPGHGIDDPKFLQPQRPMSAIGG